MYVLGENYIIKPTTSRFIIMCIARKILVSYLLNTSTLIDVDRKQKYFELLCMKPSLMLNYYYIYWYFVFNNNNIDK